MATWQYRCQSCGGVHEVSVRPAGAMLLRCTVSREWGWHDESVFLAAGASPTSPYAAVRTSSAGGGKSPRRARAGTRAGGAGRKRASSPSRARSAAGSRRGTTRKTARRATGGRRARH
jgi:hypothetical protein